MYRGSCEHWFLVQCRPSHETLAEPDVLGLGALAVAHRQLHLQLALFIVDEQDAECAVVDETLGQAGNACQQCVEVENRRHLAADFGQRLERVDVLPFRAEQPGVLQRHGDVSPELAQQRLVALGEGLRHLVQQIQRADDASLAPHRHRQLRQHVAQRTLVARLLANVVHQNGASLLHGRPHHALAHLETHRIRCALRVADRVRNPQFLTAFVEQIDGKRAELGQTCDELRDLDQQLFEIEDRRDLAAQLEERGE